MGRIGDRRERSRQQRQARAAGREAKRAPKRETGRVREWRQKLRQRRGEHSAAKTAERMAREAADDPGGDFWIHAGAVSAVLFVAAVAFVISFVHIQHLAFTHGQDWLASNLQPLSIDLTIVAASLTMLRAVRRGLSVPWLARTMLVLGVGATLACNVAYGIPFGPVGELISAWPAVAFIGSAEMLIGMARRTARGKAQQPVAPPSFTTVTEAARVAYERSVAGGNPFTANALATRFGIPRPDATRVVESVNVAANGHAPSVPAG